MFPPNTRILVADDIPALSANVETALRGIGFTGDIHIAPDGQEAWIMLEELLEKGKAVELIISDWNMPKMTGIEFLRQVRSDPDFKEVPFFMLTTEAESENVVEAAMSGVTDYILKPVTQETIQEKLEKAWKKLNG